MREAITYIEQPILFAASKGMSFVYRRFGVSSVRQVRGWEMAVSVIELVAVSIVFTLLYRAGERSLVYILPFLTVSMALDAFTNHRKFKRLSNAYDAKAYRQAMMDAEKNRVGSLFLRGFSLVIPVSSLIVFTGDIAVFTRLDRMGRDPLLLALLVEILRSRLRTPTTR